MSSTQPILETFFATPPALRHNITPDPDIQVVALQVCSSLAEAFLKNQKDVSSLRALSFSGADIAFYASTSIYQFLSQQDGVPLSIKAALCHASFSNISSHYLETSHKKISQQKIDKLNPSSSWEKERIRLRLQANDIVLAQIPLMQQTLSKMGYMDPATLIS